VTYLSEILNGTHRELLIVDGALALTGGARMPACRILERQQEGRSGRASRHTQ
jgi:hypothetical protein